MRLVCATITWCPTLKTTLLQCSCYEMLRMGRSLCPKLTKFKSRTAPDHHQRELLLKKSPLLSDPWPTQPNSTRNSQKNSKQDLPRVDTAYYYCQLWKKIMNGSNVLMYMSLQNKNQFKPSSLKTPTDSLIIFPQQRIKEKGWSP